MIRGIDALGQQPRNLSGCKAAGTGVVTKDTPDRAVVATAQPEVKENIGGVGRVGPTEVWMRFPGDSPCGRKVGGYATWARNDVRIAPPDDLGVLSPGRSIAVLHRVGVRIGGGRRGTPEEDLVEEPHVAATRAVIADINRYHHIGARSQLHGYRQLHFWRYPEVEIVSGKCGGRATALVGALDELRQHLVPNAASDSDCLMCPLLSRHGILFLDRKATICLRLGFVVHIWCAARLHA